MFILLCMLYIYVYMLYICVCVCIDIWLLLHFSNSTMNYYFTVHLAMILGFPSLYIYWKFSLCFSQYRIQTSGLKIISQFIVYLTNHFHLITGSMQIQPKVRGQQYLSKRHGSSSGNETVPFGGPHFLTWRWRQVSPGCCPWS